MRLRSRLKPGPAVHLPLDHLDPVDVALDRARAVGQGQPGGHGLLIAADAGGDQVQLGLVARCY